MGSEELPQGWTALTLRDVVENQKGKVPKKFSDELKDGFEPYIDIAAFETGKIRRYATTEKTTVSSEQDVLIVWDGARFGLSGKFSGGVLGSTLVRLHSRIVPQDYLLYFIRHHYRTINSRPRGTGTPHIEPDVFWPLQMGIPPANEQRRIVEKIESLFARLDKGEAALRQVQTLLKRYRQSVLKAAVTGELTRDWRAQNAHRLESGADLLDHILATRRANWQGRGQYKEPAAPVTTGLPQLPEGWVWASVDQLLRAKLANGRSVRTARDGFPVLQLMALAGEIVDVSQQKIGEWNAEEAAPFTVQEGDILVSRGNGSRKLVGKGGLVAESPEPVAYPDTMIRIPVNLGFVCAEWFLRTWNSPFIRQQIERVAKTTAGIYKINQTDIRNFVVPLPPLNEQQEIVDCVDTEISRTETVESACQTELARSQSLRQSILKQAFSGQLVPQDPNDEPASELLARIRAERAAAPPKRRRKARKSS